MRFLPPLLPSRRDIPRLSTRGTAIVVEALLLRRRARTLEFSVFVRVDAPLSLPLDARSFDISHADATPENSRSKFRTDDSRLVCHTVYRRESSMTRDRKTARGDVRAACVRHPRVLLARLDVAAGDLFSFRVPYVTLCVTPRKKERVAELSLVRGRDGRFRS